MSNQLHVRVSPVYRPHWLAYWRLIAAAIVLSIAGFACLAVSVTAALLVLAVAAACAVGMCLYRTWHFYYFTDDRRLVYRHGFLGRHVDVFTLFGRITQTQMPVLGKWLDVGDVNLGTVGPDLYLQYIGQFEDFRRFLMASA